MLYIGSGADRMSDYCFVQSRIYINEQETTSENLINK